VSARTAAAPSLQRVRTWIARRAVALAILPALAACAPLADGATAAHPDCIAPGRWVEPGRSSAPDTAAIIGRAASAQVVLLGEQHDNADHHRWQLHMLAALHARTPGLVIGFEMFPRRVQPVLDRWVAGELSESRFLREVDWRNVWRFDPQLYLPLFHFARLHRIPMIALNVERALTRGVAERGWDAIPDAEREGVTRAAPPSPAYRAWLTGIFGEHGRAAGRSPAADDAALERFIASQLVWDRAMAEGLSTALRRPGATLAVGIVGAGHVARGFGVPYQLGALGIARVQSLIPWPRGEDCGELVAGYADAVYGVPSQPDDPSDARPRLGILLDRTATAVLARKVEPGGIGSAAGLQDGDVFVEVAGHTVTTQADVIDAVRRQAPGTWLPMRVRRGERVIELVAKFPASPQ